MARVEANSARIREAQKRLDAAERVIADDAEAAAMASAMNEPRPAAVVPSPAELEKLRAELRGVQAAGVELERRARSFERPIADARSAVLAAARGRLREHHQPLAQERWEEAIESLREAACELMAIAKIDRELRDPEGNYRSPLGLTYEHGPAAALIEILQRETVSGPLKALRPNWLPMNGPRLQPYRIPGVAEAKSAIFVDLGVEGAI